MPVNEILNQTKTIAVIGCSSKKHRTSFQIADYLLKSGYEMIPVNPNESEVLGRKSYPSVPDIPGHISIDLFTIFRNRAHTIKMVEGIAEWSEKNGKKPPVWTQLGVSSSEAKELAADNGFQYIEERCIMAELEKRTPIIHK
jgi:uncharacterized protein